MEDSTQLADVRISYDHKNGSIRLLSSDPRLAGKPFQLTITANSDSYKSLFELLENQGLVDMSKLDIPRGLKIDSVEVLAVENRDPRSSIQIGEGFANTPITLDLRVSPHVLIAGSAGSGKSVVLRNFIAHGLAHESIELRVIDLKRIEFAGYKYRAQDQIVTTIADSFTMLRKVSDSLTKRYSLLDKAKVKTYRDLPDELPAIYVVIDELSSLLTTSNDFPYAHQVEMKWLITNIVKLGRAVGIYGIFGAQRIDADIIPGEINQNIETRILMGNSTPATAFSILGATPQFGGSLLNVRGRGIIKINGAKQELFQGFFLPLDKLK